MPATATIIGDTGEARRRRVQIDIADEDGAISTVLRYTGPGAMSQAAADVVATDVQKQYRNAELNRAIRRCIDGEDPATIPLLRVARPKLWETMTRRLHNGPKNELPDEDMRGLAQWVVDRATPAIVADLNSVRTAAEVNNTLKPSWQALLDAVVPEFDDVSEEEL